MFLFLKINYIQLKFVHPSESCPFGKANKELQEKEVQLELNYKQKVLELELNYKEKVSKLENENKLFVEKTTVELQNKYNKLFNELKKEREEFEKNKNRLLNYLTKNSKNGNNYHNSNDEIVKFNIGGQPFCFLRETICSKIKNPNYGKDENIEEEYFESTYLERLVLSDNTVTLIDNDYIFIDRDSKLFHYIANYIRNKGNLEEYELPKEEEDLMRLKNEADYFLLPGLIDLIERKLLLRRFFSASWILENELIIEQKTIELENKFNEMCQNLENKYNELFNELKKEREEFEIHKNGLLNYLTKNKSNNSNDIVKFNIGGQPFCFLKETICSKIKNPNYEKDDSIKDEYYEPTLLETLISSNIPVTLIDNDYIFIDRNPKLFHYIANYLRYFGSIDKYINIELPKEEEDLMRLKIEADFFGNSRFN
ncbi:hypothetical protein ABK040_001431 [Willaertia magna]